MKYVFLFDYLVLWILDFDKLEIKWSNHFFFLSYSDLVTIILVSILFLIYRCMYTRG